MTLAIVFALPQLAQHGPKKVAVASGAFRVIELEGSELGVEYKPDYNVAGASSRVMPVLHSLKPGPLISSKAIPVSEQEVQGCGMFLTQHEVIACLGLQSISYWPTTKRNFSIDAVVRLALDFSLLVPDVSLGLQY